MLLLQRWSDGRGHHSRIGCKEEDVDLHAWHEPIRVHELDKNLDDAAQAGAGDHLMWKMREPAPGKLRRPCP